MKNKIAQPSRQFITALLAVMFLGVTLITVPMVQANRFEEQIRSLNNENAGLQDNTNRLANEAASLADTITALQAQISNLQTQIQNNQQKRDDTLAKIAEAEAELAKQKKLLGENIKAMYLEGQISTIEMLASSKDLSEFVDKEQYRNTVKNKIKTTMDRINALKIQLDDERATLEKLIADQQTMQNQLASQQAEQNRLLALNQAQRNELDQQIRSNGSRIAQLRAEQAAENARLFASGRISNVPDSSGYPWADYRGGSWTHGGSCYYGDDIDPWGMCYRQCVSYAAWKTYKTHGYMPYGWGDAKNWDDSARAAGISVNSTPQAGSIAVSNYGTWGHVMFVESVNGNGTITISQYNASLTGQYSVATISSNGLTFIHF